MNCASARELIERYLDGELDSHFSTELEEHLANCDECGETFARSKQLQSDVRTQAPYYRAPAGLEDSVRDVLRRSVSSEATAAPRHAPLYAPWRWGAIAASVLLMLSLGWNFAEMRSRTTEREVVAEELLSSHVRSLMGNHLLDVVSSDQHTVKPWFAGKLDFAPDVKNLSQQGFPLLGGRVEYFAGHIAAALVYGRRQHIVNLFVWPSTEPDDREQEFARKGYHFLHWSDAHMTYWAVSDVAAAELRDFRNQYKK
jgi:anti-sigma factor RsiW